MSIAPQILLRGEDSDGRVAVVENTVGGGFPGPPLHVHPAFDEGFYVLEGELTFRVRDDVFTVAAGGFVFASGATPHTFANRTERSARYLILITPPGFERYFERLAAEARGEEPSPAARAYRSGTEMVGPRIGASNVAVLHPIG
jgi:mannose-6-phosphate isomerase-like protein (cupin superfamily)